MNNFKTTLLLLTKMKVNDIIKYFFLILFSICSIIITYSIYQSNRNVILVSNYDIIWVDRYTKEVFYFDYKKDVFVPSKDYE